MARELVKKYPYEPSLTLAKMLYSDNKLLFKDAEQARDSIRQARGARGNKKSRKNAVQIRTKEQIEISKGIKSIIPDETPFKVENLTGAYKWLLLPDMHIPYFDLKAIEVAVAFGKKEKCDGIIYPGDLSDCYSLSTFDKDPSQRDFLGEIAMVKKMIYEISRIIKPSATIWKMGNHEHRLSRFLMQKAPILFKLPSLSFEKIYDLERLKVKTIPHTSLLRYQKLTIGHGDEFGSVSSAYPARGVFLRTGACTYVTHWHRSSTYTETDLNGDIKTCWSSGCLCYSDDTEILTQDGYKLFKDVKDSDLIGVYDKTTDTVKLSKPKARQVFEYSGNMISFKGCRIDALVTPDHKMMYCDHSGKLIHKTAQRIYDGNGKYNFKSSAPFDSSTQFNKDLSKLCMWIVTEGSYDGQRITIYQKKQPQLSKIIELVKKLNLVFSVYVDKRSSCSRVRLNVESTKTVISKIWGGVFEKRIPRKILGSDSEFLKELLGVLVSADGSTTKAGSMYIATISDNLAQDYLELIQKIGYNGKIHVRYQDTNFKKNARINIVRVRKTNNVFAPNVSVVKYNGLVYDFTSDTGWLVVRRNGHQFISSNCNMHPEYAPVNKWNHGFGILETKGKYWEIKNKSIIKSKVFEG